MEGKLAKLQTLAQKDKSQAYTSVLFEALAQTDPSAVAQDVHTLVNVVLTQDHVGLVVGRQVLAELVKNLKEGVVKDNELRKQIIKDTLAVAQPRLVSYEEQVCPLQLLSSLYNVLNYVNLNFRLIH